MQINQKPYELSQASFPTCRLLNAPDKSFNVVQIKLKTQSGIPSKHGERDKTAYGEDLGKAVQLRLQRRNLLLFFRVLCPARLRLGEEGRIQLADLFPLGAEEALGTLFQSAEMQGNHDTLRNTDEYKTEEQFLSRSVYVPSTL